MQADAQTTEPTAAEMDAALVFTVDGYSDAEGVDHVTVIAAEKSLAAAAQHPVSNTIRWHRAEQCRLRVLGASAKSPLLRASIETLVNLKQQAFDLGQKAEAAQKLHGPASYLAEAENQKWIEAQAVLHEAAAAISRAEVRDAADALIRAEAFANGIDNAGDLIANSGIPESEEDCVTLARSYRAALQQIADREKPSAAFESLLKAYDQADAAYHKASAEYARREAELERRAPVPPELVIEELKGVWWRTEKMLIAADVTP